MQIYRRVQLLILFNMTSLAAKLRVGSIPTFGFFIPLLWPQTLMNVIPFSAGGKVGRSGLKPARDVVCLFASPVRDQNSPLSIDVHSFGVASMNR